ncbi:chromosomal replication initiator protein DnaA [candidate division KSB1 bacterium]|nr:chromosomal replication initiator protein DnaA [candidate division KSB1 bacterium]
MSHSDVSAAEALWQGTCALFRPQIPEQSFTTWIQPVTVLRFVNNLLHLGAPTQFHREWIEGHYLPALEHCLRDHCGGDVRVKLEVVARARDENPKSKIENPRAETGEVGVTDATETPSCSPVNGGETHGIAARGTRGLSADETPSHPTVSGGEGTVSQLNPRYTFENFVEGDSNSFARAACMAMADFARKCPWNPLLLYGGTGLGKTHLLQAIGNKLEQRSRRQRVLYVTSERFTQEFIHSVRTSNTTEFASRYRTIDLLLVDDIQFFAAKERTQVEFFHAFNTLYQAGKRIALTCDRPLAELAGFDQRLISRFDSGLVTNIDPPDYETRVAILLSRAEQDEFPLTKETADLIATHVTQNVRELEGVYVTLAARCQLSRIPPTMELVRDIIRARTGQAGGRPPAEKILEVVSEHFRMSIEALKGPSRKKELVFARMMAISLIAELTPLSLKAIGQLIGGRDHSTVIHARDTIDGRKQAHDPEVKAAMDALLQRLSLLTLMGRRG